MPEPLARLVPCRFRKDERGATAVEFAMVAFPFFAMLFGIIGLGLYFFTTFALENAVEQAARQFRTGQAQTANVTASAFKTSLCTHLPGHMDCGTSLQVHVASYANSADITSQTIPQCTIDNATNRLASTGQYTPGGANMVLLVYACYEWALGGRIPWWYQVFPGAMANGSVLIQAATTFRTEPYN